MSRERDLVASNGYAREVGFNPLDCLKQQIATGHPAAWLDLRHGRAVTLGAPSGSMLCRN
jgi:hypothetical protein